MSKLDDMWLLLPKFYQEILEFRILLNAESEEIEHLDRWIEDFTNQLFIDTATWGIERWENVFGVVSDASKPFDQRRAVIKAKIRGAGVTTVALIKEVAESWYNGEIEVTEEALQVMIKFNSNFGIPDNLPDVEKALREIIPAHLLIEFLFSYLLIRDIHEVKTLIEMESITLNNFAGGA